MLFKKYNHTAEMIIDLKNYINDYKVVNVMEGNNHTIYVLCVNEIPERIDGMFVQSQTKDYYNYRVLEVSSDNVNILEIKNQYFNYSLVQPIENDKILLVGGRCRYYNDSEQDKNGKVFDWNGQLIREFVLGDGIEDIFVTESNIIWTSYFDEGVFGNNGWENPIGALGLLAWDSFGNKIYEYNGDEKHFICDCYALNVTDEEEVWFYYYTDFLLGKLDTDFKIRYYDPNHDGADGFILNNEFVLFRGGYNDRHTYHLYKRLKKGELRRVHKFSLLDKDNNAIESNQFTCRGSRIVLFVDNKLYSYDLNNIEILN